MVDLCQEMLEIVDILDPGLSKNRSKILKELLPAFMHLMEHQQKNGLIGHPELQEKQLKAKDFARQLVACFKVEKLSPNL